MRHNINGVKIQHSGQIEHGDQSPGIEFLISREEQPSLQCVCVCVQQGVKESLLEKRANTNHERYRSLLSTYSVVGNEVGDQMRDYTQCREHNTMAI